MADDSDKSDEHDSPSDEGQVFASPVYEMFWDCEYCATAELLGKTHRHCPACGALQDANRRYFPPEDKRVAVVDHVYYGADQVCRACENPNSARASFCGACGAELDDADPAAQKREEKETKQVARKRRTMDPAVLLMLLAFVFLGLGLFAWNFFFTESVEVTVRSHSWRRVIAIEQYAPETRSVWCDALPANVDVIRRAKTVRAVRKVADGEVCQSIQIDNRDGTFRSEQRCRTRYKNVREYDMKCFFRALAWQSHKNIQLGEEGVNPRWPESGVRECPKPRSGCLREGKRAEHYYLQLDVAGETERCSVSQDLWQAVKDKDTLSAEISGLTSKLSCASLTRTSTGDS